METLNFTGAATSTNSVINYANDYLNNFYPVILWGFGIIIAFWFMIFLVKNFNQAFKKIFK